MSCRKINLSESQIQKIVLIVNLCMVITSIILVSIQVFAWKNDRKHINTAADTSNYGASCLPCEDIDSGYSVVRTADAHVSMKLTQQHADRDILECCMDRENMIEMVKCMHLTHSDNITSKHLIVFCAVMLDHDLTTAVPVRVVRSPSAMLVNRGL